MSVTYECELRFLADAWGGFRSFGTRRFNVNVPPEGDDWNGVLKGYIGAGHFGDFILPLTDCWFNVERVTTRAWTDDATGEDVTEERRLQVYRKDWARAKSGDVWAEATDRESGLIQDDDLEDPRDGEDS